VAGIEFLEHPVAHISHPCNEWVIVKEVVITVAMSEEYLLVSTLKDILVYHLDAQQVA